MSITFVFIMISAKKKNEKEKRHYGIAKRKSTYLKQRYKLIGPGKMMLNQSRNGVLPPVTCEQMFPPLTSLPKNRVCDKEFEILHAMVGKLNSSTHHPPVFFRQKINHVLGTLSPNSPLYTPHILNIYAYKLFNSPISYFLLFSLY